MTCWEINGWLSYRQKHGPLNLCKRIESGFGMLASLYANSKSKTKVTRYDFMDYTEAPPVSIEQAMEEWF